MTEYFGHKFSSAYGSVPTDAWVSVLEGLPLECVQKGLSRTIREYEKGGFPPGPLDFRLLCFPASVELGLPSEDDAFSQSLRSNALKHPWVKEMLRTMSSEDVYKFRRSDEKKARTLFKKYWDPILNRAMAGEEAPEVELEIEDKPVKASKETAAEGMAALKGLFGN